MNITLITPSYTLGGVETQSFHLAEHFIKTGKNVSFVCIRGDKGPLYSKLTAIGVKCYFFYPLSDLNKVNFISKIKIVIKLFFFLRSLKPTVLLPFTEPVNTMINILNPFLRVKLCFYTMRSGYITKGPHNKFSFLIKYFNPVFVSNSEHGARIQAKHLGIDHNKFHIIRNGIKKQAPVLSPVEWREKLNIQQNDFVFIMVANYYAEKRHDLLLDAWKEFAIEKSDVKLLLVGDKSPYDRDYFKIKAQILDNKLYDTVITVERINDIAGILGASDCGILLTESEGCPNSLLEYMIYELPVIASKIDAIEEILGSDSPFLVENGDKLYLIKLLDDNYNKKKNTEITKFLEKNKEIITNKYSYKELIEKYYKLIE